ncbi:MAG: hypothetical protein KF845_09730 [Cyclobacteriaceae bacterium]|nr:hypothetical protein [Cyclobacteriaceae bacterium]
MKTTSFFGRTLALAAIVLLGATISCEEDNAVLQEEAADITEDVITDYFFEDADDIINLVLLAYDRPDTGDTTSIPRTIVMADPRLTCNEVVVTITMDEESSSETPKGRIVINFGEAGCTDASNNVRKGKLIVDFTGRRFLPGSTIVTSFDKYTINDIKLEGVRTLTNISTSNLDFPRFGVELESGKITWPDGTEAMRTHCFIREWIRAANPLNDAVVVDRCTGANVAALGINRRGRAYTMLILEQLMYKRGCPIAVKGVKQFVDVATGKVIMVDYGDGNCDSVITVSVDGYSRSVNVGRRG